jgi:hypothetical protein
MVKEPSTVEQIETRAWRYMSMNKRVFATLLFFTTISVAIISLYPSPVEARSIIVDGDPSDWAGIPPIVTDPDDMPYDDVDLSEVYATNDEDCLYIRMDVYGNISGMGGAYQFMVDVDRNGTWDFQFYVMSGWGGGYTMPTYDPVPLNFSYFGSTVEMNVSLSDLGFPKAMDLTFFCSPYDMGYPTSLYIVGSNTQTITVDGDPNDWTGSPFFMDDVGDAVAPSLDLQGGNGQVFIGSYMFLDTNDTVIEFSTPLADIGNPSNVTISGGIRSLTAYMDQGQATYAVSETETFDVVVDDMHYSVSILSNSTVSDFNFNQTKMQISFNATGDTGTTCYCNVTIPKNLLTGSPWTIKVDDTTIIDFVEETNDTHTFLYLTYIHESPLQIMIEGTWIVPEFSLAMILPLFMILSLITIVFVKHKLSARPKSHTDARTVTNCDF